MATLQLKDITKIYTNDSREGRKASSEEKGAVRHFSLDIEDNEFIVLVGPSGCGKSTTLRMIAGLEDITEGELYIDGKLMNDVAPKDRDIAMVFQNYALYPHMTVYENMAISLKLRKASKEEIDRKVREAADILGITEYLNSRPKVLSGGQRQRVAIGRAIVRDPKVMLMDEPLSNLDAKLRNEMRSEIIKLRQRINTTFVYVTHDQIEAMTLGDRVVIMKDGYIQQIGTPQEVYDHPANLFVAGFIGTPEMNFFDSALEKDGEKYYLDTMGYRIRLPEETEKKLSEAGIGSCEVTSGIRPDHLRVEESGIASTVDVREMMGSSVYLHLSMGDVNAVTIVPSITAAGKYQNGSSVSIGFDPEVVHLFSRETGDNLIPFNG